MGLLLFFFCLAMLSTSTQCPRKAGHFLPGWGHWHKLKIITLIRAGAERRNCLLTSSSEGSHVQRRQTRGRFSLSSLVSSKPLPQILASSHRNLTLPKAEPSLLLPACPLQWPSPGRGHSLALWTALSGGRRRDLPCCPVCSLCP